MGEMNKIDIEKIMEEIREDIKEKGYKASDVSFNDIAVEEISSAKDPLAGEIEYLNANHLHDVNMSIVSNNTAVAIVKKIIKKIVKFLFYPVLVKQNSVNASLVSSIKMLAERQEKINELEGRIKELEDGLLLSGTTSSEDSEEDKCE